MLILLTVNLRNSFIGVLYLLCAVVLPNLSHGQNLTKPNIKGPFHGISVNSYNGNLFHKRTDLYIPSLGPDLEMVFAYNSSKTLIDYGYGSGWTHSLNIAYELNGSDVIIRRGDGRKDLFTFDGLAFNPPTGIFDILTEYMPGQYKLQAKNGSVCYFDDTVSQRATRMEDRHGNALTMSYSAQELETITDASGRTLTLSWSGGRMIKVTDNNASPIREITYTYDGNGMPVAVTDPLGNSTLYAYDNAHKLIDLTNKNGVVTSFEYNAQQAVSSIATSITSQTITYNSVDLITEVTEQVGLGTRVTAISYDGSGNAIQMQNPCCTSGLNIDFQYDADRNITQLTDGNGNVSTYTYDTKGNQLTSIDPLLHQQNWTYEPAFNQVMTYQDENGNSTSFSYDGTGNLLQTSKPEGVIEISTYNSNGTRSSYTDGEGNLTSYVYNIHGYLTEIHHPIGVETFTYDNTGNRLSATDANGNTTTYEYDALDRLTKTTDPAGEEKTSTYDSNNNRTSVTDELGNVTSYSYDALDRIVSEQEPIGSRIYTYDELGNKLTSQDANGNITSFEYNVQNTVIGKTNAAGDSEVSTYDANGNLTSRSDFNGNTTTYAYDSRNQLLSVSAPLSQTYTYTYDANGNRKTLTDPNGNITTYNYDGLDRLVNTIYPIGTTSWTYDDNSNTTSITDPNGNSTLYVHDAMNRVVMITDPLGNNRNFDYDAHGNTVSSQNPLGNIATSSYDSRHLIATRVNEMGETTSYTHDAAGNRATETWPGGNVITYTYDANHRLIALDDLIGTRTTRIYDDNGNQLSNSDGDGHTTSYSYDTLNRLASSTDGLGQSVTYSYDANSNLLTTTDRSGQVVAYEYDALNRQTRSTDEDGYEILSSYDPNDNLLSVIDENGHATSFTYDAMNRLSMEMFADGTAVTYTYDASGNLTSKQDNMGQITNYSYDARDHLLQRDFPGSNDDTFTYDANGRMSSAQNANALIIYAHDAANRTLSESLNGETVSYVYDISNRKRTINYPGGRVITEQYDFRNRLSTIEEGVSTIANMTYDLGDRPTTCSLGNGTTTDYTYNAANWLTEQYHIGADTLVGFKYSFDNEGNRLSEEKTHQPIRSETYTYNNSSRISGFERGQLVGGSIPAPIRADQYNFDGVSNRTSTIENGVNTSYSVNSMNEYITISDGVPINPAYDANGNLQSDNQFAYSWDSENRLTQIDAGSTAEYVYDPFDRRISKILPGETVNYYYDGWSVIEERNGSNITNATYVYGDWIDDLISMNRNGQTHYYHSDSRGSIAAMTDASGIVVERYEYDPFGSFEVFDDIYNPISPSLGNPYFFTGRRMDKETGLYHFRNRFYNPRHGTFISRDPMGYVDGMNLYPAYFAQGFGIDPMGTKSWAYAGSFMKLGPGHEDYKKEYDLLGCDNETVCGTITVEFKEQFFTPEGSNEKKFIGNRSTFTWEANGSKSEQCCLCGLDRPIVTKDLGWIQLVHDVAVWRFDNGAQGNRLGAKVKPSATQHKVKRPSDLGDKKWKKNPWYGGEGNVARTEPKNWDDTNPTPQQSIDDRPKWENEMHFITKLTCVNNGNELWKYKWGQYPTDEGGAEIFGAPGEIITLIDDNDIGDDGKEYKWEE